MKAEENHRAGADAATPEAGAPMLLSDRDRLVLEAEILPKFLLLQRWFAAKDRTIAKTSLSILTELGDRHALAAVDVDFDGGSQRYFLPLAVRWEGEEPASPSKLATLRREEQAGSLIDGAADPAFAELLLQNLRAGASMETPAGTIAFQRTKVLEALGDIGAPRLSGADQSNASIVFGDRLILKIYRRLRAGSQPDVEMARFLTETTGFANTPAYFGSIELKPTEGEATTLAAAFAFVPDAADAWQAISGALGRELERVDASEWELSFPLDIGELLGRRTAELHCALASPTEDPAFSVEPTTQADVETWVRSAVSDLEDMIDGLERADLFGDALEIAEAVLASREELFRRAAAVSSMKPSGGQSRIHGDYHLGQVLAANDDLMIIDFEGEPRRPLQERRAKSSPLRDVAGMLRSLDYLAAVAIAGHAESAWSAGRARQWRDATSGRFLGAYQRHVAECATYPKDPDFARGLLDLFLIQKAAYEVSYELENRPDWARIPLRGLLDLLEKPQPPPPGP